VGNANLLEVARGAIGERLDYELGKVVENISDLNTKADAVRKITLTLSLKPDSERQNIKMSTQVNIDTNEQHRKCVVLDGIRRGQSISRNVATSTGTNGVRRFRARRTKGYSN
jgi:hypothetical protein